MGERERTPADVNKRDENRTPDGGNERDGKTPDDVSERDGRMPDDESELDESRTPDDVSAPERAALHEVELGLEWLQRAHGHLVEFHHNTGHAMDHLAEAETRLRECGYDELADALRDEFLPRGVIDNDRWSYDVLECFQEDFLTHIEEFETDTRNRVADGQRHVAERKQEREWKRRARK